MAERIKIENFGPIKHAELDLKKVNVIIGPVASGKSIISKLIYLFRENHTKAGQSIKFGIDIQDWGLNNFLRLDTNISYEVDGWKYHLKSIPNIQHGTLTTGVDFNYSWNLFIPAERVFHSEYLLALPSLAQYGAPTSAWLTVFANEFKVASGFVGKVPISFLNTSVDFTNDVAEVVVSLEKRIPLLQGASGILAVTPVCTMLKFHNELKERRGSISMRFDNLALIIEEPELNLNPSAQRAFVEYLVSELVNTKDSEDSILLTTHSPYVITAIDNCIQAQNTFNERSDLAEEITKIIPQNTWLDFSDLAAYQLVLDKEGKSNSESILDNENKMIQGNKIDDVSLSMEMQLQQLLDLRYHNHVL